MLRRASAERRLGAAVARRVAGSWRSDVENPGEPGSDPVSSATLAAGMVELLEGTGSASLAWRMLPRAARDDPAWVVVRARAKENVLRYRQLEATVERVVCALASAEVASLVVKGWAVAQHYADPSARPVGDLDVCVAPGRYDDAVAAVGSLGPLPVDVDLHDGFGERLLPGVAFDVAHGRAIVRTANSVEVRTPALDDHLRLVALHALRHGLWRPVWLCDVAALLDGGAAVTATAGDRTDDYVRFVCDLARSTSLWTGSCLTGPGWAERAVLREWGRRSHWVLNPSFANTARRKGWWFAMWDSVPDPLWALSSNGLPMRRALVPLAIGRAIVTAAPTALRRMRP